MNTAAFTLTASAMLLFPILYFFIASLAFFLRQLDDPVVTSLLRGLFDSYFLAFAACCVLAIAAFIAADRPGIAVGLGGLAICAIAARRWFLRHLDQDIQAGDAGAPGRLRRLQVGGIIYNTVQGLVLIASMPFVFAAP